MIRTNKSITVQNNDIISEILGVFDENLLLLESVFNVNILVKNNKLEINGFEKDVDKCIAVINKMIAVIESGNKMDKADLTYNIELVKEGRIEDIEKLSCSAIAVTANGKSVKCKTVGQKKYIDGIKNNTICFGIGPAGTGKTYLAVAMAVKAFKTKQVEKIILTRPAVEAGEKLGFLPGDLQEKIDPYLRPLYDALQEFFGQDKYNVLLERGTIEIAPLAYMRGRTLNNAFIILDEAQNTTKEQMKMFLTRLGQNSRMVVTGDITQIDLPYGKESGLNHSAKVLEGVDDICIVRLDDKDVVRNQLVTKIVNAYKYYQEELNKVDNDDEE